jgi:hypothetical protein
LEVGRLVSGWLEIIDATLQHRLRFRARSDGTAFCSVEKA